MTELEPYAEDYIKAANIADPPRRQARAAGSKKESQSMPPASRRNARFEHCCPDPEACKALGGKPAKFARRANADEVTDHRHEESADAVLASTMKRSSMSSRTTASRAIVAGTRTATGTTANGHLYRTLDPEAGCRKYTGTGRYWMGGYGQTATSVFVHAPVAINCFSANENEATHYPTLYERTVAGARRAARSDRRRPRVQHQRGLRAQHPPRRRDRRAVAKDQRPSRTPVDGQRPLGPSRRAALPLLRRARRHPRTRPGPVLRPRRTAPSLPLPAADHAGLRAPALNRVQ